MNLRECVNLLPRTLANRYSDLFWINAANTVLTVIGNRGVFSWNRRTAYLPFDSEQKCIQLPETLREVIGVKDQFGSKLPYTVEGRVLEFAGGRYSGVTTSQVANVLAVPSDILLTVDLPVRPENFTGWAVVRNDGSLASALVKFDRQIDANSASIGTSGYPFSVGDEVEFLAQWVAVEYTSTFLKITDPFENIMMNAHLIHEVMKLGLWYYALRETDETGDDARSMFNQYQMAVDDLFCSATRRVFQQKPRFGFRTFR